MIVPPHLPTSLEHYLSENGYIRKIVLCLDNDEAGRIAEEKGQPLLQVCSHIANGAKHFEATKARHKSVQDVEARRGKFFGDAFFGGDFFSTLNIHLDGQAAILWGAEIAAVDLASVVLKFWKSDSRLS